MFRHRPRHTPTDTPDPRHVLPIDDDSWNTRTWTPRAEYPSSQFLASIYGCRSLQPLFVHGADRIVCPFPPAPRLRDEPSPKTMLTDELATAPARLTWVDPRSLYGSQSWILRQHVSYYVTDRWERTGIPSAEDTPANRFPIVVRDTKGRFIIIGGHHRAAAALVAGTGLLCRLVSHNDRLGLRINKAVAFTPTILWGRSTHLGHVVAHTADEILRLVSQGNRVLCPSRDEAIRAALWMHPRLPAGHFGLEHGSELDAVITGYTPGQFSAFQPVVNVVGSYQMCTTCGGLLADKCHFHGAPDVCACLPDPPGYDREQLMPCYLCQSCRMVVVSGHFRLRTVVCGRCRDMTNRVNREIGFMVFPQGIHSMVNSGTLPTPERSADVAAAIEEFLTTFGQMSNSVQRWGRWSDDLLVERMRALGFDAGRTIPLEEYLDACTAAGLTAESGFHELIERAAREMPPFAGELRSVRADLLRTAS